jgi:hypothetical protein
MESILNGVVLFELYTSFKTRSSIKLCQNKKGYEKNVEQYFDVLQSKWTIIQNPC